MRISPEPFLDSLTGKIYKLIPMRDDKESGIEVFLDKYLNSLTIEMIGAMDTYPDLSYDEQYISIVNTVQYMAHHSIDHAVWRREAFKMLNTLSRVRSRFGGGQDGQLDAVR